jgi:ketosteroid isomerase-like protein
VSADNVRLVEKGIAAWNRGDLDGWLELLGPEFEYRTAQVFLGIDPVYRGEEGMRRFWKTFRDAWESIKMEFDEVVDLGDRVLTRHVFRGRGKQSGVEVTLKYANIFTFKDGLIVGMVGYGEDWDAARAAAGLS